MIARSCLKARAVAECLETFGNLCLGSSTVKKIAAEVVGFLEWAVVGRIDRRLAKKNWKAWEWFNTHWVNLCAWLDISERWA